MGGRKKRRGLLPHHGQVRPDGLRSLRAASAATRRPAKGPPAAKKKPNFKFLVCLLAGTALAAIGVHFLHAFQVKRNAGALLHQADQAEKEGNLRRAADYLIQYLA